MPTWAWVLLALGIALVVGGLAVLLWWLLRPRYTTAVVDPYTGNVVTAAVAGQPLHLIRDVPHPLRIQTVQGTFAVPKAAPKLYTVPPFVRGATVLTDGAAFSQKLTVHDLVQPDGDVAFAPQRDVWTARLLWHNTDLSVPDAWDVQAVLDGAAPRTLAQPQPCAHRQLQFALPDDWVAAFPQTLQVTLRHAKPPYHPWPLAVEYPAVPLTWDHQVHFVASAATVTADTLVDLRLPAPVPYAPERLLFHACSGQADPLRTEGRWQVVRLRALQVTGADARVEYNGVHQPLGTLRPRILESAPRLYQVLNVTTPVPDGVTVTGVAPVAADRVWQRVLHVDANEIRTQVWLGDGHGAVALAISTADGEVHVLLDTRAVLPAPPPTTFVGHTDGTRYTAPPYPLHDAYRVELAGLAPPDGTELTLRAQVHVNGVLAHPEAATVSVASNRVLLVPVHTLTGGVRGPVTLVYGLWEEDRWLHRDTLAFQNDAALVTNADRLAWQPKHAHAGLPHRRVVPVDAQVPWPDPPSLAVTDGTVALPLQHTWPEPQRPSRRWALLDLGADRPPAHLTVQSGPYAAADTPVLYHPSRLTGYDWEFGPAAQRDRDADATFAIADTLMGIPEAYGRMKLAIVRGAAPLRFWRRDGAGHLQETAEAAQATVFDVAHAGAHELLVKGFGAGYGAHPDVERPDILHVQRTFPVLMPPAGDAQRAVDASDRVYTLHTATVETHNDDLARGGVSAGDTLRLSGWGDGPLVCRHVRQQAVTAHRTVWVDSEADAELQAQHVQVPLRALDGAIRFARGDNTTDQFPVNAAVVMTTAWPNPFPARRSVVVTLAWRNPHRRPPTDGWRLLEEQYDGSAGNEAVQDIAPFEVADSRVTFHVEVRVRQRLFYQSVWRPLAWNITPRIVHPDLMVNQQNQQYLDFNLDHESYWTLASPEPGAVATLWRPNAVHRKWEWTFRLDDVPISPTKTARLQENDSWEYLQFNLPRTVPQGARVRAANSTGELATLDVTPLEWTTTDAADALTTVDMTLRIPAAWQARVAQVTASPDNATPLTVERRGTDQVAVRVLVGNAAATGDLRVTLNDGTTLQWGTPALQVRANPAFYVDANLPDWRTQAPLTGLRLTLHGDAPAAVAPHHQLVVDGKTVAAADTAAFDVTFPLDALHANTVALHSGWQHNGRWLHRWTAGIVLAQPVAVPTQAVAGPHWTHEPMWRRFVLVNTLYDAAEYQDPVVLLDPDGTRGADAFPAAVSLHYAYHPHPQNNRQLVLHLQLTRTQLVEQHIYVQLTRAGQTFWNRGRLQVTEPVPDTWDHAVPAATWYPSDHAGTAPPNPPPAPPTLYFDVQMLVPPGFCAFNCLRPFLRAHTADQNWRLLVFPTGTVGQVRLYLARARDRTRVYTLQAGTDLMAERAPQSTFCTFCAVTATDATPDTSTTWSPIRLANSDTLLLPLFVGGDVPGTDGVTKEWHLTCPSLSTALVPPSAPQAPCALQ